MLARSGRGGGRCGTEGRRRAGRRATRGVDADGTRALRAFEDAHRVEGDVDRRRVTRRRVRGGGERGGRELELARVDVELRRPSLGDELKGRRVLLPQHPRRRRRAVVASPGPRRDAARADHPVPPGARAPPAADARRVALPCGADCEVLLTRRGGWAAPAPCPKRTTTDPQWAISSQSSSPRRARRRLALGRRDDRRVEELELRQRTMLDAAVVVPRLAKRAAPATTRKPRNAELKELQQQIEEDAAARRARAFAHDVGVFGEAAGP